MPVELLLTISSLLIFYANNKKGIAMQERPPFIMLAWHTRECLLLFTWKTIKPWNIKPKNDNLLTSTGHCSMVSSIFWTDRKQFSEDISFLFSLNHPLAGGRGTLKNTLCWFMHLCLEFINCLGPISLQQSCLPAGLNSGHIRRNAPISSIWYHI